jgi:ABC-type uncharacterized transport system YnjBCD permease subunit
MNLTFGEVCMLHAFSVMVVATLVFILAQIRGDFPSHRPQQVMKILIIICLPAVNVVYGIMLLPYLFGRKR